MARNIGLVAAFEEEQALAEVEAVQVEGVIEDGDNLETHVGDMVEAEGSVDAELQNIDDGVQASDELEAHQDIMEGSLENGGMDETAAQVVEVAIESIRNRLGMSRKMTMPALESFGAKSNRVQATRLAMEELPKFLKTIWDAIKNAFKKVSDWIKSFWIKLTDGVKALGQRAEKLKAAVEALGKKKITDKEVSASSFGSHIATTKGATPEIISNAFKKLLACVQGSKALAAESKAMMVGFTDLTGFVDSEDNFDKAKVTISKTAAFVKKATVNNSESGAEEAVSEELSGGVVFAQTFGKGSAGINTFELISRLKLQVMPAPGKVTPVEKMATLSTDQMKDLINTTLDIVKAIEATKPVAEEIVGLRNKFDAAIEKVSTSAKSLVDNAKDAGTVGKALVGNKDAGVKAREIAIRKALININKYSNSIVTVINGRGVTTGKRVLDYVGASISAYGDK
jgi:hypothetical protein